MGPKNSTLKAAGSKSGLVSDDGEGLPEKGKKEKVGALELDTNEHPGRLPGDYPFSTPTPTSGAVWIAWLGSAVGWLGVVAPLAF